MINIFVITAPEVVDTGVLSFKFMFDSKAPYHDFWNIANRFGHLQVRPYRKNEISLASFVRSISPEPAPSHRLELVIAASGKGVFYQVGMDYDPSTGITDSIRTDFFDDLPPVKGFVLLTDRKLFDELMGPLHIDGLAGHATILVHHFDGPLSTG